MKIIVSEFDFDITTTHVCISVQDLADHYIQCLFSPSILYTFSKPINKPGQLDLTKDQIRNKIISEVKLDVKHGAEQIVEFEDGSPMIIARVYDKEKLK